MTIRNATFEDLQSIHDIQTLSFNEERYPLFVLRQFLDVSEDYFLVAEEDKIILGYSLGNLSNKLGEGWILSLGVSPEARGKEIGKTLITNLIAVFENNNSQEICTTVNPNNTSAIKIYKDLDFEVITASDNYYLDNESRFLMKKKAVTNIINS